MKTMSYLTGNLLFDGNFEISSDASISIVIEEVGHDRTVIYSKKLDFDKSSLPIFKYLPFELKDFEFEPGQQFELHAHLAMKNEKEVVSGDFLSDKFPVITGFEELNLQMKKIT